MVRASSRSCLQRWIPYRSFMTNDEVARLERNCVFAFPSEPFLSLAKTNDQAARPQANPRFFHQRRITFKPFDDCLSCGTAWGELAFPPSASIFLKPFFTNFSRHAPECSAILPLEASDLSFCSLLITWHGLERTRLETTNVRFHFLQLSNMRHELELTRDPAISGRITFPYLDQFVFIWHALE